ncbi:proliferation-associated protein 2G4-like [Clavelina lepadiformis]|uniref:Peptidase M24 domain-containing protein n=1 Tax=Clavelina lepadiformis TaxID=159417 RepID=A0ABP0F6T2_CLALP
MADSGSDSEPEPTIAEDVVVTKYKMAGGMANNVMKILITKCVDGANTLELSKFGDDMIIKETSVVFKKEKNMLKGVGFPTCISVNNCVCHYSPLDSEKDIIVMKKGDVVKIDLAVHIDGFIAAIAHTLVVGCSASDPVTDRRADVINAAHLCSEAALRLVKAGNKTEQVTNAIAKVAESFNCKPVEGMLSHQLRHNCIDGEKTIIQNPTEKQKQDHEESEFECHEVYAVDCLVSTGDGHPRSQDTRTTIYKRNPEIIYQLKMKASRAVFSEVEKKFNTMCFTIRSLEDEKKAKMGIVECTKHDLCTPFPVLWEKEGELVAQFKFTVLLMPNMPLRITDSFFESENYKSSLKINDPEIQNLLNSSTSRRTAKKKKKKAASKAVADSGEPAAPEQAAQ